MAYAYPHLHTGFILRLPTGTSRINLVEKLSLSLSSLHEV